MSEPFIEHPIKSSLQKPKIVAEIGCNHRGEIATAKQLIVVAKSCGADVAKFQKRNPRELLTKEQYNAPYDNPNSYGKTYGEHREFLEFSMDKHRLLKSYCEEHGISYATSVWDMTSAQEITSLHPQYIKVPAACNNNLDMLEILRDEFDGEVHISVGMSTTEEVDDAVDVFKNVPHRLVLYACTSGYPVDHKDVCLLEIDRLLKTYKKNNRIKAVGFSGHHRGISIDPITMLLGASWIERHFTLDRTWKGSDHAASLEPEGLRKLVRDCDHLVEAWKYKSKEFSEIERASRSKLKYRKTASAPHHSHA